MTEANKFLDKQSEGYDEVKLHEMLTMPKIKFQSLMAHFADEQLLIFIDWFGTWQMDKNLTDYGINEIQEEFDKSRNL